MKTPVKEQNKENTVKKDLDCKIFVSYHKPYELLKTDIITPIHVGRALSKNKPTYNWMTSNMIGDDTGENISFKNPNYCELTAQYWAWKNCEADYIGFFHYRRFLNLRNGGSGNIEKCPPEDYANYGFDTKNIKKLIRKYDIILPEIYYVHPVDLPQNIMSPYKFYKREHYIEDLDAVINIIKRDYPDFVPALEDYIYDSRSIFFNMFIMRKDIFNGYCEWLFDILEKSEKYIKISNNTYQSRVFGFLSERLINVYMNYITHKNNNLRCLHTGVITKVPESLTFDKNKFNLGKQVYLHHLNSSTEVQRKIEVVFAADDKYCRHCCAAIASILLNSDKSSCFRFHILDGGIKDKSKKKLLSLKKLRNFEINFYDMKKYDFSQFKHNRAYISEATYYRLYLLDLLPQEVEKVIYLDCDVIVEKDLKELWNNNISEYLAGVVEDEGSTQQQRRLALPSENSYFNAGVLVLNIKELRNFDFKNKCINYFRDNEEIITLQDQDILNGVLNGKCKFLPLCWNTNGRIYQGNDLEHRYSRNEEIEAGYNPAVIHYTDVNKPWKFGCCHPLKEEYWKYLKYTNYINEIFVHNLNSMLNFVFKIQKTRKENKILILNTPVICITKGTVKTMKFLGLVLYSRIKNPYEKKIKILGIKEITKTYNRA